MKLTLAEVVYLEAHGCHCPYNAKSIIDKVVAAKQTKQPIDHSLNILGGLCQKVLVDKENFKKLYKSAFSQGMFDKTKAVSFRHSLT